jgi:hypothetical protein
MPAPFIRPTELEHDMGRIACRAILIEQSESGIADIVAELLAAYRHRCTSLVEAQLAGIAALGVSDHALAMYERSYTSENVRGLIDSVRTLRAGMQETARYVRESLAQKPLVPSAHEEVCALRERLEAAHRLARMLRTVAPDVIVDELVGVLGGAPASED